MYVLSADALNILVETKLAAERKKIPFDVSKEINLIAVHGVESIPGQQALCDISYKVLAVARHLGRSPEKIDNLKNLLDYFDVSLN
jgi:hypothetical protein